MKTVTIQIGNSDDKLSQKQWSDFVSQLLEVSVPFRYQVHFAAGCINHSEWQNYCLVVEMFDHNIAEFKAELTQLGKRYLQDSIAVTVGETIFV